MKFCQVSTETFRTQQTTTGEHTSKGLTSNVNVVTIVLPIIIKHLSRLSTHLKRHRHSSHLSSSSSPPIIALTNIAPSSINKITAINHRRYPPKKSYIALLTCTRCCSTSIKIKIQINILNFVKPPSPDSYCRKN